MIVKSLILIIALHLVVFSVGKHLPNLSFGFRGTFIRNTTESNNIGTCHLSQHDVEFNPQDRTAFVSVTSLDNNLEDTLEEGLFWLIHNPQGAPSNFFGENIFVLFQEINMTEDDVYCSYSSYLHLGSENMPDGNFPPEWQKGDDDIKLESWFSFPADLHYEGIREYKGIEVDLWQDTRSCTIFGGYTLPCFSVATLVDQAVPVFVERVHSKRPGSFEEDWIQIDEWQSFDSCTPTISPPTSWSTTCYNTDNGLNIQPSRGFVATPSGCDSFTITLNAPPPASDSGDSGDSGDSVRIIFVPTGNGCTWCAQFETADGFPLPEVTFTTEDWNVEKRVFVCYLSEGESYYNLVASGGGYEIRNWETGVPLEWTASETLRIQTCESGIPGYGC